MLPADDPSISAFEINIVNDIDLQVVRDNNINIVRLDWIIPVWKACERNERHQLSLVINKKH